MSNKQFIGTISFILIILIAIVYVFAQLMIGVGAEKERESKECVGAVAIQNWEGSLKIAKEICVNSRDEIKGIYENEIQKNQDDAKYWKDAYLWLKKQNEVENNDEM